MLLIHGWTWYKKWAWTCSGESTLLEGGRTIRDYLRWILIYILRLTSYLVAYSSCLQHIPIVHFLHLFIIVFDSSLYYLKLQSNITIFLITHLNSVTKYRLTKRYRTKNLKEWWILSCREIFIFTNLKFDLILHCIYNKWPQIWFLANQLNYF